MSPRYLVAGLLVALLAVPAWAADKKAKDNTLGPMDSDKLAPGEYTGKLLTVPGSDGSFVVEVQYQEMQAKNPNPRANNNVQNQVVRLQNQILQEQAKALNSKKPAPHLRRIAQLQ